MPAPYKAISSGALLTFAVIVIGVGGTLVMGMLVHPLQDTLGGWAFALVVLPMAVAMIGSIFVQNAKDKRRFAAIAQALQDRGFHAYPAHDRAVWNQFRTHLEQLGMILNIQRGLEGVVWLAHRGGTVVFEHEYTTGSGKHIQVHHTTVVARIPEEDQPKLLALARLPAVLVFRPRAGEARLYRHEAGEDVAIGDPVFDKNWCIYGSREGAQRFLMPEVREVLMESPRSETWYLGGGWAVCAFRRQMDAENVLKLIDHSERILSYAS